MKNGDYHINRRLEDKVKIQGQRHYIRQKIFYFTL